MVATSAPLREGSGESAAASRPGSGSNLSATMQQVVSSRVVAQLQGGGSDDKQLNRAVHVAQEMFGVAVARLTLFDMTYEWVRDASTSAFYRAIPGDAFVTAAAADPGIFTVVDAAADERFRGHPAVTGPDGIRFYASIPIRESDGTRVGSLRLADTRPRILTEAERFVLQELVRQVEKEMARRQELSQVAVVQRSLLPKPLAVDGYDLGGACSPARVVGGDFYDWYLTKDDNVALTLGDVMGKGIGAATVAATVRGVMRSGARRSRIAPTLDAATAALDTDMDGAPGFVTLFHGRLDPESGEVGYVDAGHGLALLVDARTRSSVRLNSVDLPLGLQPEDQWHELTLRLQPGDMIVAVSDGVLDFFDGSLIALEEVEAIALESGSAQQAADEIVRRATDGASDDITALVIRRLPA